MSENQHTTGPGESTTPRTRCWPRSTPSHQVAHPGRDRQARSSPSSGRSCTPSSPSTTAPRPSTAPRASSRSPGPVHPWSRSSASPTSPWRSGMSTDAGRTYLGDAVELRYRLPKLWAVTTTGRVPVWKARKIAQATKSLCLDAAAYVDRHLAHQARRCSFAQIDRAVDDALRLFDPAEAEKRRREAADARHFDVDLHQVSFDGTVHVDADLDLADALDLNDAITAGAAQLADLGSTESLDVRRSLAAGALARRELTLDLQADDRPAPAPARAEARADDLRPPRRRRGCAGVENTRSSDHASSRSRTGARAPTPGHHPTGDRPQRQPAHRRLPAHRDHARAGGPHQRDLRLPALHPTITDRRPRPPRELRRHQHHSRNLAPLCRGHHRYKTHAGWDRRPHRTHDLHLDQPATATPTTGTPSHTRHTR